jgi:predicted PurR-regulated permease PerM
VCASHNFWRYLVLTILGGYGVYILLGCISSILSPFIAGFIGAYIFSGVVQKLEHYKIPRGIASACIILMLLVFITVFCIVALPYLQKELVLLTQNLPILAKKIYAILEPCVYAISTVKIGNLDLSLVNFEFSQAVNFIAQWVIQFLINMLSNGMVVANVVTFMVLTPLVMFYLLKDWPNLLNSLDNLLPTSHAKSIRNLIKNIHRTLSFYAQGQALACVILMVLYSVSLYLTGLKQFLSIGILTGFLAFVPYVGIFIGLLFTIIAAFEQFQDYSSILITVSVYCSIYLIDGNILTPRLIGHRVGLHPLWILFAVLVGGLWFGFPGIFLAIPTAAVIGVLVRTLLANNHTPKPPTVRYQLSR